ncbi:hypothetical protein GCM10017774_14480 [Lentzea cavernae]|uniref:Uncharacterized protein n=1 Tax=Lentzea cavernae TaxID=2020703 RepID=A0ABQ3M4E3_9PSEU|nr:hypothetical protein GCM10017774_14480 [Lentzea cavernae]
MVWVGGHTAPAGERRVRVTDAHQRDISAKREFVEDVGDVRMRCSGDCEPENGIGHANHSNAWRIAESTV